MPLTNEYVSALIPLSQAFETYAKVAGHFPVLVGGAATAIYTDGRFPSGDFDVVAASDPTFDAAMLEQGFIREDRAGKLKIGFYHPDHPNFGYQQVTGPLFDGRSDSKRLVRVTLTEDGAIAVVLPAIEDIIADRLAQHAIASPTDESRLLQAQALFKLAATIDMPYLLRRILDEQGDPALLGL
jgi:hypothetical protein